MTDDALQHARHQLLVGGRCIYQPELYLNHFVKFDVSYVSSLLDVDRFGRYLIIGHRQVETAEHSGSSERVQCLIKSGEQKTIEFRDRIQSPEVYSHSPAAIIPPDHNDWRCPRRD